MLEVLNFKSINRRRSWLCYQTNSTLWNKNWLQRHKKTRNWIRTCKHLTRRRHKCKRNLETTFKKWLDYRTNLRHLIRKSKESRISGLMLREELNKLKSSWKTWKTRLRRRMLRLMTWRRRPPMSAKTFRNSEIPSKKKQRRLKPLTKT